MKHRGYNYNTSSNGSDLAQQWKYNNRQLNESLDLDLYEMDLRQYDPAIARWTSIDPVTHYGMSTYNGYDNNPIIYADPSGGDVSNHVFDNYGAGGSGLGVVGFDTWGMAGWSWDGGSNFVNSTSGESVNVYNSGIGQAFDRLVGQNNPFSEYFAAVADNPIGLTESLTGEDGSVPNWRFYRINFLNICVSIV